MKNILKLYIIVAIVVGTFNLFFTSNNEYKSFAYKIGFVYVTALKWPAKVIELF
jgi:hypothetical protein